MTADEIDCFHLSALEREKLKYMKNFAVKHPVIFSILLFFAGLVLALVCSLPCAVIGLENGTDIGRILASVILLLVFRYALPKNSFFKGLGLTIPGLLFVAWNIAYNLLSSPSATTPGLADVIACIAPALFEETILRVISIYFLKENGRSDLEALILSAVIFGAVHLTNIAGTTPVNAAVQAGYAAVISLCVRCGVSAQPGHGFCHSSAFLDRFRTGSLPEVS